MQIEVLAILRQSGTPAPFACVVLDSPPGRMLARLDTAKRPAPVRGHAGTGALASIAPTVAAVPIPPA